MTFTYQASAGALYSNVFNEKEIQNIKADIEAIKLRKESAELKLQGDIFFAKNLLNESLEQYSNAVELDPKNEYALSNMGVIHLKR